MNRSSAEPPAIFLELARCHVGLLVEEARGDDASDLLMQVQRGKLHNCTGGLGHERKGKERKEKETLESDLTVDDRLKIEIKIGPTQFLRVWAGRRF